MMKNYKNLYTLALGLAMSFGFVACDDDEEGASADFVSIASTSQEKDAATITIPLRNAGNAGSLDVNFGGTATEGEDYTFEGITSEGVRITIIDDNKIEATETIRVSLLSGGSSADGNAIHTHSIVNNCEDTDDFNIADFAGDYEATEKYGPTQEDWYGPYTIHLVQDEEDPTMFHFDNLYDSGCDAYMIFDLEAGTVYFPDQAPCDEPLTNSAGTFTIDNCNGSELNIDLNYDGSDWTYTFKKHL